MRRLASVLAIGLLAAGAAAVLLLGRRADQERAAAYRANVVLITIDTLRADRVGPALTPAIDALAGRGARFTNARAAAPLTLPSHVTIMTGMLPPQHGVRHNGVVFRAHAPTLARALREAKYQTGAFVGAYVLDRRFGLADGFDTYDDRVPRDPERDARLEAERSGAAVADAARAWLATVGEPFFAWIHLYDPHAPYTPAPEFLARAGANAYNGEVAYADAQVARVLDALRQRGLDSRSVIAVTGDHGEGLGEHGEQTHGMLAYDSTLHVPLVVAGPGLRAGTVAEPVSLVELAGTLLKVVGVTPPGGMSPRDVLSEARKEADIYAETEYPRSAGWHPIATLADDRWKLILSSEPELYDLHGDSGETRNVAAANLPIVEAMTKRLGDLSQSGTTVAARVDPEAAERLRALGYASGSPSNRTLPAAAPNPARVIRSWNQFELALLQLNSGNTRAALTILEALTGRHPESPVFHSMYARALSSSTGSETAALAILREMVKRWPNDADLFHDLAVAAAAAGDSVEALRAEQAALALEPEHPAAHNGFGLLHAQAGRPREAATAFERAAKADPSNASYWTNLGNVQRELGNREGAAAAYRRALEARPNYPDALNGLGVLLVQQGRPSEAIAWFERALQQAPALHEARLNLGIAYQESGQREKAAAVYRELLATAPPAQRRERQAATELLRNLK